MRGRRSKTLNRPMSNCLYPVYPEDEARIIDALKGRLGAFRAEKERNEKETHQDPDRERFLNTEIHELRDLIRRLEKK